MAHVEDESVLRRVENAMQRDRQFDHTEIRPEMPAGLRKDSDQFVAHFLRELRQVLFAQRLDVGRRSNAVEQTLGAFRSPQRSGRSEESDFVICAFGFIDAFGRSSRFGCGLKIFHYGFAGAVASNDFDLLLGAGKPFLTNLHQVHSFFVAHDQFLERQFAGLHLFDNRLEPVHRFLKIQLCLGGLDLLLMANGN